MGVTAADSLGGTQLRTALAAVLQPEGRGPIRILSVKPNPFASRYESSILRVEFQCGEILEFLCKSGTSSPPFPQSYRRGVGHEARVYTKVLAELSSTTPRCFGSYDDSEGQTWLFLDYLGDMITVNRWPDYTGMEKAAEWLGRFHVECGSKVDETALFPRFDQAYYTFWADRALGFTQPLHAELPWLPAVLREPERLFGPLLDGEPTVVHGEFYPPNVLFDGNAVYPVDWECCAIAPPELDVAFLMEGWPPEVKRLCGDAYNSVVEREGIQAISTRRLGAARVYLAVRYLGHKPGLAARQRGPERLEVLRTAASKLGVSGA